MLLVGKGNPWSLALSDKALTLLVNTFKLLGLVQIKGEKGRKKGRKNRRVSI